MVRRTDALARDCAADPEYLEAFLLTYNSFISGVDLMMELIKRYEAVPIYSCILERSR